MIRRAGLGHVQPKVTAAPMVTGEDGREAPARARGRRPKAAIYGVETVLSNV